MDEDETADRRELSISRLDFAMSRLASRYYWLLGLERKQVTRQRRQLLQGPAGTVVEIGPGDGRNFALYPITVQRVIAVEPRPSFRQPAGEAAASARLSISVVPGTAEDLPVQDYAADAMVVSLVLCSVADQRQALAEIAACTKAARRVVRFRACRRAPADRTARSQARGSDILAPVVRRVRPYPDTLTAIQQAGFDVSELRRLVMQATPGEPPLPYIIGSARRVLNSETGPYSPQPDAVP